jgi:hypothetical protein
MMHGPINLRIAILFVIQYEFLCILILKKEAAYFLETSYNKYRSCVVCSYVCEEVATSGSKVEAE